MFSLFLLAFVTSLFAETNQNQLSRLLSGWGRSLYDTVAESSPWRCTEPLDCEAILLQDSTSTDGVYTVCPGGLDSRPIDVQCNMEEDGWTMVLKRFDGSVEFFNRSWEQMKHRVGPLWGEHWLGLEDVHLLTSSGRYSVMVETRDAWHSWTEVYNDFSLSGEVQHYRLRVEGFDRTRSSTDNSPLDNHNNFPFNTYDNNNDCGDHNCVNVFQAPGWFCSYCGAAINPSLHPSSRWGLLAEDVVVYRKLCLRD